MFTIRIDRFESGARDVFECPRYRAVFDAAARTARIDLFSSAGDVVERQLKLDSGDQAFVMNDAGTTVDIVRTPAKPRAVAR